MGEWRKVQGFENYEINIDTKEGRCVNKNWRGMERPLGNYNNRGWLFWTLSKNGKAYTRQAAVWIALTFPELVENEYFEGAQIDHKDTDRQNNHPSNLRWVTPKENSNNPITKEHYRQAHIGLKPTEETKKKLSQGKVGDRNPNWGKHLSEEHKRKISESVKKRYKEQ